MKHLLVIIFLLVNATLAKAQTCTAGQSPVWSANGWTCASPTALPSGTSLTMVVANEGVTGTTANRFVKLTGAPSKAIIATTTDVDNAIGVCVSGCGITGNAVIAIIGQVSIDFDAATTAGDYVNVSTTTGGKAHDGGATFPTVTTFGRVLSTNGASGTFTMELMTPDLAAAAAISGNGKSKPGGSSLDYQYNNSGVFAGAGLKQETADIIAQRNGTNSQKFNIYQTYTDASNNSGTFLDFTGGISRIAGFKNGSGTVPAVSIESSAGNVSLKSNGIELRWDGANLLGSAKDLGSSGSRWNNTWTKTFSPNTNAPSQITSNQNNYTFGADQTFHQLLTTDAARSITGINPGGITVQDGQIFLISNTGSFDLKLVNESASSSAANRFTTATGGDINLAPKQGALVFRDVAAQRYRVFANTQLSGSGTLAFGNLVSIGCEDLTITVTGAASGDTVALGVPNGSVVNGTATFSAWVSAAGTVTVRYCNLVSGQPASGTFTADVWHH